MRRVWDVNHKTSTNQTTRYSLNMGKKLKIFHWKNTWSTSVMFLFHQQFYIEHHTKSKLHIHSDSSQTSWACFMSWTGSVSRICLYEWVCVCWEADGRCSTYWFQEKCRNYWDLIGFCVCVWEREIRSYFCVSQSNVQLITDTHTANGQASHTHKIKVNHLQQKQKERDMRRKHEMRCFIMSGNTEL